MVRGSKLNWPMKEIELANEWNTVIPITVDLQKNAKIFKTN